MPLPFMYMKVLRKCNEVPGRLRVPIHVYTVSYIYIYKRNTKLMKTVIVISFVTGYEHITLLYIQLLHDLLTG